MASQSFKSTRGIWRQSQSLNLFINRSLKDNFYRYRDNGTVMNKNIICKTLSNEPRKTKKNSYFPSNWLFNFPGSLCHGLLLSPHTWIGFHLLHNLNNQGTFLHCSNVNFRSRPSTTLSICWSKFVATTLGFHTAKQAGTVFGTSWQNVTSVSLWP